MTSGWACSVLFAFFALIHLLLLKLQSFEVVDLFFWFLFGFAVGVNPSSDAFLIVVSSLFDFRLVLLGLLFTFSHLGESFGLLFTVGPFAIATSSFAVAAIFGEDLAIFPFFK
jgi:hypothetical protein